MSYTIEKFLLGKIAKEVLGDNFCPSLIQIKRFNIMLLQFPNGELKDWKKTISHFLLYDVTNYAGRIRRLKKFRGLQSLYALILRFGKTEAVKRFSVHKQKAVNNLSNTLSYWISRGFTEEEATINANAVQKSRSHIAGDLLRGSSDHSCRTIGYWMKNGYSETDAKIQVGLVQSRQHTTERNIRWQETLNNKTPSEKLLLNRKKSNSIEGIMRRGFSLEEAIEKNRNIFENRTRYTSRGFSKISQTMFDMIVARIGVDGIYFATLNYEKNFMGKMVDFYDSKSKVAIEFLGDWYHANPMIYSSDYEMRRGMYAAHIREDDRRRTAKIMLDTRVAGVYYVWESEFRKNPTEVINLIVEFLLEQRSAKSP